MATVERRISFFAFVSTRGKKGGVVEEEVGPARSMGWGFIKIEKGTGNASASFTLLLLNTAQPVGCREDCLLGARQHAA